MFDFSFSEIALIGAVALVVIGPERLPKVARTTGVIVGRVRRYAAAVQADIAREVELSELRRVQTDLKEAAQSFQSEVQSTLASAETHLSETHNQVMMPSEQHQQTEVASSPHVAHSESLQQSLALELPVEPKPSHAMSAEVAERKG
jgi:sec-independent protein translocase protein TatB